VAVYMTGDALDTDRTRLQRADDTCGAASLAYLMELGGACADESAIAREVRLEHGGTNFGLLRDAAERRGYHVSGGRCPASGEAPFPHPSIAHLKEEHFVVVEYAGAKRVRLFDPAFGRVEIESNRFAWIASGYWIRISGPKGNALNDEHRPHRSHADTPPSRNRPAERPLGRGSADSDSSAGQPGGERALSSSDGCAGPHVRCRSCRRQGHAPESRGLPALDGHSVRNTLLAYGSDVARKRHEARRAPSFVRRRIRGRPRGRSGARRLLGSRGRGGLSGCGSSGEYGARGIASSRPSPA
ncbi:MAG: hypothetical protein HKN20_10305, partial [Gemmatimonadetes bacterium]|nr:hypothetical protein [Gemmatimonadota bacterium]